MQPEGPLAKIEIDRKPGHTLAVDQLVYLRIFKYVRGPAGELNALLRPSGHLITRFLSAGPGRPSPADCLHHHDDLSGANLVGQLLLEVRHDGRLGLHLPHPAVSLEQPHVSVLVQTQDKLALRLLHLQKGAVGPHGDAGLDLDQSLEGNPLPGLHLLAHAVVPGGDAVLLIDAGEQVQQIVHALSGHKLAPQLNDGLFLLPEALLEPGHVAGRLVQAVPAHLDVIGGENRDLPRAVHPNEHRQVVEHIQLVPQQLHDAVQPAHADLAGAVYMGVDAYQLPVGVGVAVDGVGLVVLEGHEILSKFLQHDVVSFLLCLLDIGEFQNLGPVLLSAVHPQLSGDLGDHLGHHHLAGARLIGDIEAGGDGVRGDQRALGCGLHGDGLAVRAGDKLQPHGDFPLPR